MYSFGYDCDTASLRIRFDTSRAADLQEALRVWSERGIADHVDYFVPGPWVEDGRSVCELALYYDPTYFDELCGDIGEGGGHLVARVFVGRSGSRALLGALSRLMTGSASVFVGGSLPLDIQRDSELRQMPLNRVVLEPWTSP
jgi:hypothetical protein